MKSFLAELKRRKVYHVAAAYGAVGLAVLGAAEVILDPLGLTSLRPVIVVLTLLGFPIALVLAWAYEVTPEGPSPTSTAAAPSEGTSGATTAKSIAVLPFDDLSPEGDQEYFVHGLSEEIINALTQVEDLKVAARTSTFALAKRDADIAAVADALGVANVLEGSVRKAGERIRITAQLIEAASGFHLWSHTFDRELTDIFRVQDEIAHAITDRLKVTLAPNLQGNLVSEATDSRGAHDAYLRGRYLQGLRSGESLQRAIDQFRQAIELDPGYAAAFAGLAECYLMVDAYTPLPESPHFRTNQQLGLEAARTAVSIAPGLGMAHQSLGMGLWSMGRWEEAEREMALAIELNPGYAEAHMALAVVAGVRGRSAEALAHALRAAELDPVSPIIAFNVGVALMLGRRTDEAIAQFQAAAAVGPGLWNNWFMLAAMQLDASRYQEGAEAWDRLGQVAHVNDPRAWSGLFQAAVRWKETGEPQELPQAEWTAPVLGLVWAYAHTGHPDEAIEIFEKHLVRQGAYGWAALAHLIASEPLHGNPKYRALVDQLDLAP